MNWKKKLLALGLSLALTLSLAACGQKTAAPEQTDEPAQTEEPAEAPETPDDTAAFKIAALKGPTAMGLVELMSLSDTVNEMMEGKEDVVSTGNTYEFTLAGSADEVTPLLIKGELDMACVPANLAAVLYGKTDGALEVLAVNTLGVLYIVESGDTVQSMADLRGKTIVAAGKGSTPEYALRYLLSENGLSESDVTLEYKSEPTEVAAVLKEHPDAIGLLPQPFVTAACAQNEKLSIVLDLTKEWEALQGEGGSRLVTGVTVVRNEFLKENPPVIDTFLTEHAASAAFANEKPEEASQLIAAAGIIEKAPVAQKALPYCNIVCLTGEEMKSALSGYLQVLFDQDAKSVGGKLPGDEFYYIQ